NNHSAKKRSHPKATTIEAYTLLRLGRCAGGFFGRSCTVGGVSVVRFHLLRVGRLGSGSVELKGAVLTLTANRKQKPLM
ncbi:MAG: hypothetical protein ACXV2A_06545, partial [Halobacteriota archaeon]